MEFLGTLTAIGKLLQEGLKVYFIFADRKKVQEIENRYAELRSQINNEGERLTQYNDLSRLIANIERSLNAIRSGHEGKEVDDDFWDYIGVYHEYLMQYGSADLEQFDASRLGDLDRGKFTIQGPIVRNAVIAANEHFKKDRNLYIERIRASGTELGKLRTLGETVLRDISISLRQFGH